MSDASPEVPVLLTERLRLHRLAPEDAPELHECYGDPEAMSALLAHCFEALDTHRIEAEIEPDNHRSLRLAERLGFEREAVLRDRIFVAGEPRTSVMHALLRPDWRAASVRSGLA